MGEAGEGQNITHQAKKMTEEALFALPRPLRPRRSPTTRSATSPFYKPADDAPEMSYLHERRAGARRLPAAAAHRGAARSRCRRARRVQGASSTAPASARSRRRWRSCASSRRCCATRSSARASCRSSPTSRAPSAWRACSASSASSARSASSTQPEDADQLMYYREDKDGQILQEGINEPGAISSWIAAATSYANNGVPMMPFYIYYSMFGFQRVGDLAWAAGDIARARLPARRHRRAHDAQRRGPAARGRPQPPRWPALIPNCVAYDPTFAYEVAVIVQDGLRRMLERAGGRLLLRHADERELRAAGDAGGRARRGSSRACTCCARRRDGARTRAAARLRHDPARGARRPPSCCARTSASSADVWSVHELHRAAPRRHGGRALEPAAPDRASRARRSCERARRRTRARSSPRPTTSARCPTRSAPWVAAAATRCSAPTASAAATTARALRRFFEVDRHYVVVAALKALGARRGRGEGDRAVRASTPRRRPPWRSVKRGQGPRHRRLQRRRRSSRSWSSRATRSPRRTRSSRSSPTRRRWTCRRRSAGVVAELQRQGRRQGLARARRSLTLSRGAPSGDAAGRGGASAAERRARRRGAPRRSARSETRRQPPPAAARRRRRAAPTATPVYASPSVRRLARELGVDLAHGRGHRAARAASCRGRRRTAAPRRGRRPAPRAAARARCRWPKVDFAKFGEVERVAAVAIKKISAARTSRATG